MIASCARSRAGDSSSAPVVLANRRACQRLNYRRAAAAEAQARVRASLERPAGKRAAPGRGHGAGGAAARASNDSGRAARTRCRAPDEGMMGFDFTEELGTAERAAREAGAVVMGYYRSEEHTSE